MRLVPVCDIYTDSSGRTQRVFAGQSEQPRAVGGRPVSIQKQKSGCRLVMPEDVIGLLNNSVGCQGTETHCPGINRNSTCPL